MKRAPVSYLLSSFFVALTCGAEFQVNTRVSNNQANVAIAADADGNSVVLWSSYGQDGSSNGVFARLFDPNCSPVGEEFQVNTTTSGNQTEPSVAMDAVGNFVVAWHGPGIMEEDIFAQRFEPTGQPLGSEFRLNSQTENRQRFPKIAMNDRGQFVIVWDRKINPAVNERDIFSQRFSRFGRSIGEEFQVNTYMTDDQKYPAVAIRHDRYFVTAWQSDTQDGSRPAVRTPHGQTSYSSYSLGQCQRRLFVSDSRSVDHYSSKLASSIRNHFA